MCNETWMPEDATVDIDGYLLKVCSNSNPATTLGVRRTGGVAIYKNNQSNSQCIPVVQQIDREEYSPIGDMCLARVSVRSSTFVMASFYIHPGVSMMEIQKFLLQYLSDYVSQRTENNNNNVHMPLILSGDFNVDVSRNLALLEYMKNEFDLTYLETPPTTLGNTCIDLS